MPRPWTALAACALSLSVVNARAAEPAPQAARDRRPAAAIGAAPANAGDVVKPREMAKGANVSEAVAENGAEFQAFAQPFWAVPAPGQKTKIELGLRVTNKTDKTMQVNVFDTISFVLKDSNGKSIPAGFARDATRVLPPAIVEPGKSTLIFRDATLDGALLMGFDGSGGAWSIRGVNPGKYTLVITYECPEKSWDTVKRMTAAGDLKGTTLFVTANKIVTKEVAIEVGPAPAAALAD